MKLDAPWLHHPGTQAVCAALEDAGHRALFVGGCVRDTMLGVSVDDIDIATDATPARVEELTTSAGLKAVPTGIAHGTITVVADGKPHEVTTFRRDVETDGRRAVVAFTDKLAEDAARRDFTMNALYAGRDGVVIDPVGGLPDLMARRLRFIGDPKDRIREDYLRILRFFRFHAWFADPAGGMDADGLAACAALADGLATLSRERVGAEVRKLLRAPDPAPAVASMAQAGILARILPGADARALPLLIAFEGEIIPDALRRLAAIGGDDVDAALRLSKSELREWQALRDGMGNAMGPGELGYRFGADTARDILLLRAAQFEQPPDPAGFQAAEAGAAATFPVRAADLMPAYSGPALGARLAALEGAWIASGFTATKAKLCG